MKTLLSAIALMFVVNALSYAQTEKGKIIISGATDLSLSSIKIQQESDGSGFNEEATVTKFNIEPSVSYFVIDNLALGLSLDFETGKEKNDNAESKDNSCILGPSIRYYFGESNIKPYLRGDVMFGTGNYESENDLYEYESKYNIWGWDLGAGMALFLNDYVAFDLGLVYSFLKNVDKDNNSKYKTKGFALSGGISIYL